MKRFAFAIIEALTCFGKARTDGDPPDSLIGESEFERRSRRMWWVISTVIFAAILFVQYFRDH